MRGQGEMKKIKIREEDKELIKIDEENKELVTRNVE